MNNIIKLINHFRMEALDKINNDKAIGYFCCYVPPEIIEASGFVPVRLAGFGDGVAENEGEKFIYYILVTHVFFYFFL